MRQKVEIEQKLDSSLFLLNWKCLFTEFLGKEEGVEMQMLIEFVRVEEVGGNCGFDIFTIG